jgi:glycosyltransferase involved in cell wall biosynthesis
MVGWMLRDDGLSGLRSVVHVHERGASIKRFSTTADFASLISRATRFVAVSEVVREDMIHLSQACRGRIDVVRNWLVRRAGVETHPAECRRALAMELGVPMDSWIVGAVGHLDRIKGPDLFIEMASHLAHLLGRDKVVFAWLGGGERSAYAEKLRHQVSEAGLNGRIFLLGARPEPGRFLAACDAVTVCSRSEGSSLVVLEASQVGVPVAVFAGSGGPVEFAANGSAGIAPGFDVAAMADLIAGWRTVPESAKAVVELARKKLASDHNREQQCRRLLEQLMILDRL